MNYVLPDRRSLAVAVTLWFVAGVLGALLFWVVQLIAGGVTIPAFIGQQIVAAGGYPAGAATAIGWAVHSGVSLSYALVFGVLVIAARRVSLGRRLAALFVVAVALGGLTTAIAPPAISMMVLAFATTAPSTVGYAHAGTPGGVTLDSIQVP